jgi:hypothetical protein
MSDKEAMVARLTGKPHCPKCYKEIDWLKSYESGEMYRMLFDDGHYEEQEFQADNGTNDYECPECCEVIFRDDDSAQKFLKGVLKCKQQ